MRAVPAHSGTVCVGSVSASAPGFVTHVLRTQRDTKPRQGDNVRYEVCPSPNQLLTQPVIGNGKTSCDRTTMVQQGSKNLAHGAGGVKVRQSRGHDSGGRCQSTGARGPPLRGYPRGIGHEHTPPGPRYSRTVPHQSRTPPPCREPNGGIVRWSVQAARERSTTEQGEQGRERTVAQARDARLPNMAAKGYE